MASINGKSSMLITLAITTIAVARKTFCVCLVVSLIPEIYHTFLLKPIIHSVHLYVTENILKSSLMEPDKTFSNLIILSFYLHENKYVQM